MPIRRIGMLAMVVAAALFCLFYFDFIQKIPTFHCESFGCIGLGILMMLSPLLVAALFFFGGVIFAKQKRLKTGLVAAGISFGFAVAAIVLVGVLNKAEVNRAQAAACLEDPATYCPETLAR